MPAIQSFELFGLEFILIVMSFFGVFVQLNKTTTFFPPAHLIGN